jgi:hypothetical protein
MVLQSDTPGGTLTLPLLLDQVPVTVSQSVIALPTQTQSGVGPVIGGNEFTVTVVYAFARPQGVITVYTIVCTPDVAPAVKTIGLVVRLLNVPYEPIGNHVKELPAGMPVNVVVIPVHKLMLPPVILAVAVAVTVTVIVEVQPPDVLVMVATPGVIPEIVATPPEQETTAAIPEALLDHEQPVQPVNVIVEPTQKIAEGDAVITQGVAAVTIALPVMAMLQP